MKYSFLPPKTVLSTIFKRSNRTKLSSQNSRTDPSRYCPQKAVLSRYSYVSFHSNGSAATHRNRSGTQGSTIITQQIKVPFTIILQTLHHFLLTYGSIGGASAFSSREYFAILISNAFRLISASCS